MFDIGFSEMTIVVIVALVILGPDRLPQAIRTVTRWLHYFKKMTGDLKSKVESELQLDAVKKELQAERLKEDAESFQKQVTETARNFEKVSLKDKEGLSKLMNSSNG